jgi:hypothetical protein
MSTASTTCQQILEVNYDLHHHLVDQYVDPDDWNTWSRWFGHPIKVDDQKSGDVDHLFCKITVTVSEHEVNQFELNLSNSPFTEDLRDAINKGDAEINWDETKLTADIRITASIKNVTYIRNLAKAFRKTTGRGADYLDRNWIWVCRRTAKSLDRLAGNITKFRRQQSR